MKILAAHHRRYLESVAAVDGGMDTELYCFHQAKRATVRPDCRRCKNTKRIGSPTFPVVCPECSRS